MRLRRVPALHWVLALGLAACTSLTVFRLAAAADARARYWGTFAEVPVVDRPIEAGRRLEAGDFRMRSVPEALLPESDVVFEPTGLTAIVPLVPGEVIVEAKLAPAGLRGPTALLAAGERAVAVPRTDTTPPLEVGDRVDVIITLDASASGIGAGPPAFPIARAASVLEVTEAAVAIAVTADQAPKVAFGAAQGAVSLVLAPPEDWPTEAGASAASAGDGNHQSSGQDPVHHERREAPVPDEAQQTPHGSESGNPGGAHAHGESGGEPGREPAVSE